MEINGKVTSVNEAIQIALAHHQTGDFSAAENIYKHILDVDGTNSAALHLYGALALQSGNVEFAYELMSQSLQINPDHAELHCNFGVALKMKGRLAEAKASFIRALDLKPDYAQAHSNLGTIFHEQREFDKALASFKAAIALDPENGDSYFNQGLTLHSLQKLPESVIAYQRALALKPDSALVHTQLGTVFRELRQFDNAEADFRKALQIDPNFAGAHNNLGELLRDKGQLELALESYRRALDIQPDFFVARSNFLFTSNYLPKALAEIQLSEARNFGELVRFYAHPFDQWPNSPNPHRKLRIGLVSGDLRSHPVGFFIESILASHKQDGSGTVEYIAYSNHYLDDDISRRIQGYCHDWRLVEGISDARLARQIHHDRIDILIDLSGHTARNRLPMFAWKPAPIQVTWLGYFATTGVQEIDYILADRWSLPNDEEHHFTEKVWHLPETRLCFSVPNEEVPVSALPALVNNHITFGCFSNLSKVNDMTIALWAGLLAAIPYSRLLLKSRQLDDLGMRQKTVGLFASYGITADRLLLEGAVPRKAYFAAYHRVDIMLDTLPFPGGTTTIEALWMGVPVLTLAGESFLERQGVSLLINANLPDWIAITPDDYIARAISHASNLQQLANLRGNLRQQLLTSTLFNSTRLAFKLEVALRGMWVRWCDQPSQQA
ncbi:tetratricopeptide repeat protein [Undibacterium sp. TJN25]|uniref:O-linked N-acetylglucosamine transferase, SPINDLY family protein n=1 Tax=Undibacterium sp. TJN25 TaxID=3413056 RepID=UPI003BF37F17